MCTFHCLSLCYYLYLVFILLKSAEIKSNQINSANTIANTGEVEMEHNFNLLSYQQQIMFQLIHNAQTGSFILDPLKYMYARCMHVIDEGDLTFFVPINEAKRTA